jgi:hypothetical protein
MPFSQVGTVRAVLVGREPQSLVSTPQPQVNVTFEGFEGDRHNGITRRSDARTPFYSRGTLIRNDRQVSLVSVEELAQIAAALNLPEIRPEWLGANLVLEGIPSFTLVPSITRLFFSSGVVLSVTDENLPCTNPGKVLQEQYPQVPGLAVEFPRAALHRRGLIAVVDRPGIIRVGDELHVHMP